MPGIFGFALTWLKTAVIPACSAAVSSVVQFPTAPKSVAVYDGAPFGGAVCGAPGVPWPNTLTTTRVVPTTYLKPVMCPADCARSLPGVQEHKLLLRSFENAITLCVPKSVDKHRIRSRQMAGKRAASVFASVRLLPPTAPLRTTVCARSPAVVQAKPVSIRILRHGSICCPRRYRAGRLRCGGHSRCGLASR